MPRIVACRLALALALAVLGLASTCRADGIVIDLSGRVVPEEVQQAFIEWKDGHERLYVATRSAASDGPTVWIVPVPAPPDKIVAVPVSVWPHVLYLNSPKELLRLRLRPLVVW